MKHEELTRRIIKVFYEVYNELGYGFIESVYENAMRIALRQEGLFVPEKAGIEVLFRGIVVGTFAPDAVVEGLVILELKIGRALDSSHEA
jgi:GxxExxY protein